MVENLMPIFQVNNNFRNLALTGLREILQNFADKSMAYTSEQVYKLGAESLGWNKSTTAGKALIAALAKGNKKSPWIYHPKI